MADEKIDIYDAHNHYIGTDRKSTAHKEGKWHRVVHLAIINENNELLMQHRAKDKKVFPGVRDLSMTGHVGAGETVEQGLIRETKEEVGIVVDTQNIQKLFMCRFVASLNGLQINEFGYVYGCQIANTVSIDYQKDEIEAVQRMPIATLQKKVMKSDNTIFPYQDYVPTYRKDVIGRIQSKKTP